MNGSYISLGNVVDLLLEPNGFTSTDTGLIGSIFVICGLISSIIFPIIIEKHLWFLKSLKIICYGAFLSSLLALCAVPSENLSYVLISFGLLGFFLIPTMSIVYALATEATYPISEALFGSLLQAASGITGTIISYFMTYVIRSIGTMPALGFLVIFYLLCSLLTLLVKEDLRRIRGA